MVGGQGSDNFPDEPSGTGRAFLYRKSLSNNSCSSLSVKTLVNGDNFFTTVGATNSGDESDCAITDFGPDVWFRYVATCDGAVTFSTCNQVNYDSVLALYDGCNYVVPPLLACNTQLLMICDGSDVFCGSGEILSVVAQSGDCFFLRVGGIGDESGTGTITVNCAVPCPEDLNGDEQVDGADLGLLLSNWGNAGLGNVDGSGVVDGADLGLLLAAWGSC
jgi:hypothetical protein